MRLNNAGANSETDPERVAMEQEEERERAKKNAISVKNSTVSENRLEVNDRIDRWRKNGISNVEKNDLTEKSRIDRCGRSHRAQKKDLTE
jgi:hypothetical protein